MYEPRSKLSEAVTVIVSHSRALPLLLVTSLAASTAMAGEDDSQTWYLGAGIGLSELDPDTSGTGYSVTDDSDNGFRLFGGVDLTDRFSLEGFYSDLGSAQIGDHIIRPDGSIDYQTLGASVVWYGWREDREAGEPLRTGIQLFLHGGLSFLDNSATVPYDKDNSVQVSYGAGLEYGFDNGLALRAALDLYDKDAALLYAGVLYRFGSRTRAPVAQPVIAEQPVSVELQVPKILVTYETDSDADGVFDSADDCPGSPPDAEVDARGCAELPVELEGVNFKPGSHALQEDSTKILDTVADIIKQNPSLGRIEVQAHTDSKGSESYNMRLSARRAESVRAYLVDQGVNPYMLSAKGYGETQPVADNATDEGRARNRRVELVPLEHEPAEPESVEPVPAESEGEGVEP